MRAFLLRAVLLCAVIFAACEQPAGQYAPPSLRINSASDLAKIGADPAWPLDGNYALAADLVLTDWKPLGGPDSPFAGTFDGGGKTIAINSFSADVDSPYFGVFAYIKNGAARNVKLAGELRVSWDNEAARSLYAGGVAGYADHARIQDCSSEALLKAESLKGSVYAGGIVGFALDADISGCHASGGVEARGQGHNSSAGGVGGYFRKTLTTDCSALGDIDLRADPLDGLSGPDYLYMIYAGGLVGYTGDGSRTERSYARGAVYAAAPYPYAGGLVGYNYGDLSGSADGAVVAECYADGRVRSDALMNGLPYAGGLAGYTSQKGELQDSYAAGDVEVRSEGRFAWAGGITGSCANSARVSRCYARGNVSALTGSEDLPFSGQPGISEGALAGGIAGYVYWNDNTFVENCAALNASVGASGGGSFSGVHRIAGRVDSFAKLSNNIAAGVSLVSAPAADIGPDGLDGADAELTEGAFAGLGWDFAAVWKIGEDSYPVLRWQ